MWATYILYSAKLDRHYVGYTSDIDVRLQQHRNGSTRTTSRAKDWTLVFLQNHPDESAAVRLERSIKAKKSRKSIQRFIQDQRNEAHSQPP